MTDFLVELLKHMDSNDKKRKKENEACVHTSSPCIMRSQTKAEVFRPLFDRTRLSASPNVGSEW